MIHRNKILRIIRAALLLALMACAGELYAQGGGKLMTSPEKNFSRIILANGLEVIVIPNHAVPIATVELAVRNGSFTEGPEYAGLSHLYEHMFFKGNSDFSTSQEFIGELGRIGALYNATTREEVVFYYYTLPVENLTRGMEIMANTVQTPLFDPVELEREREVVLGEFNIQESSPFFPFSRAMDAALWGDNVTRKQPIGQRPVIKTATPEKMRFIQHKYYIPNNSLLIVAGDVDSTQVFKLATKYFSSWKRQADPFATDPPPQARPLEKSRLVTVPVEADVGQVDFRWHGPSIGQDDKATYAADVFIKILEQPQSRFQRRLVETGIGQGAGINYYTQRYTGPISLQIVTTPDNVRRALDALWKESQDFDADDYFTDEELETAKAVMRMEHLYDSEETTEWTHTMAFWWSTSGLDYFRGYLDNLSKVSRADVQNYIRKYIKGKPYVLGISATASALQRLNIQESEVLR